MAHVFTHIHPTRRHKNQLLEDAPLHEDFGGPEKGRVFCSFLLFSQATMIKGTTDAPQRQDEVQRLLQHPRTGSQLHEALDPESPKHSGKAVGC